MWAEAVGPFPPGPFVDLAMGGTHLCGLRPDGTIECWGERYERYRDQEPAGARFRDIAMGSSHVCGVTLDGELLCWGDVDPAYDFGQTEPPPWP